LRMTSRTDSSGLEANLLTLKNAVTLTLSLAVDQRFRHVFRYCLTVLRLEMMYGTSFALSVNASRSISSSVIWGMRWMMLLK
jgi:hypothetical protein